MELIGKIIFFRSAPFSNIVVSANGGSDDVDYYISANSYKAQATIINQDFNRLNLRTNLNAQLNEKLKIGIKNFVSRSNNNGARANLATGIAWDMNTPPRDSNGNYNSAPLVSGVGNGSPRLFGSLKIIKLKMFGSINFKHLC